LSFPGGRAADASAVPEGFKQALLGDVKWLPSAVVPGNRDAEVIGKIVTIMRKLV
jgi:hypothetical protein